MKKPYKSPEYYKNFSLEDIRYVNDFGTECVEIWKDIPDYVGLYKASDLGRFKSLDRTVKGKTRTSRLKGVVLRPNIDRDGYSLVSLSKDSVVSKLKMHRLVAQIFIPNPDNLPEVNHVFVDEFEKTDKQDNRVVNLQWSDGDSNRKHAQENGLVPRGIKNHNAKLTEKEVLEIRASIGLTHEELSKKYNIARTAITKIINRKSWKHI